MITKQQVQHIAKLARLGITEKEEEKFAKELSSILDYIEKLKEVDVSNVQPTSHPYFIENVMRKDEAKNPASPTCRPASSALSEKLLREAPETKDGYVKVKSVF